MFKFCLAFVVAVALIIITVTSSSASIDKEQVLLNLINNYRQENGLSVLSSSESLERTADWMSNDMAANDYFSHIDSLGRDPFQRVAYFGYDYNTWKGENLVAGTADPQLVLALLQGSPLHNAVLLNSHYRAVGVSLTCSKKSTYHCYWVIDLGGYVE